MAGFMKGMMDADLNGNGKVGFGERLLGLDPGIRALASGWRSMTGRNLPQTGWGQPIQRQQFGTTQGYPWQVNDLQNNINYDSGGINPNYGQTIGTTMPKPRPVQYPTRNGLDFMDTAGTGYQSLNKPLYQPNAMQVNNGYFDMGKANTVGGNWVNGAGWRTDANKAFGQTEEDMAFNAQMAQRLGTMAQ